jgi:hypothetical protein
MSMRRAPCRAGNRCFVIGKQSEYQYSWPDAFSGTEPHPPGLCIRPFFSGRSLAPGDGGYDEQGLGAGRNRIRQRDIRRLEREILRTGEETHPRATPLRGRIAQRAAQHGIARLERIEHGTLRDWFPDLERHLVFGACQRSQRRPTSGQRRPCGCPPEPVLLSSHSPYQLHGQIYSS